MDSLCRLGIRRISSDPIWVWCLCGDRLFRCGCRATGFGIYQCDNSALGHFVANLNCNFSDDPPEWGGYIHGGFVAFERDQRIFRFDLITRGDQNLYDIDRLEIADIREANFFWISHVLL